MGNTAASSTGITFRLNEPGMNEYLRAGLAGLFISIKAVAAWKKQRQMWPLPEAVNETLEALEQHVSKVEDDDLSVCLEWPSGGEKAALEAIVKWAWQYHDGIFFLPGIHRKREHLDCYYLRLHVHNGLLGTFFQHGRTIKKDRPEQRVERFDEEKTFSVRFRRIESDTELPQHKVNPLKKICRGIGEQHNERLVEITKWIYPGSEPRFNNNHRRIRPEKGWEGPARFAYLMLFAPIACYFFKLPRTDKTDNWAYMIPDVRNLHEFYRDFLRQSMVNTGNWPFHSEVAGLEDAASRYTTRGRADEQSATVVIGKADYNKRQLTRKNVWRDIAVADDMNMAFRRYDIFNRVFPVGNTIRPWKQNGKETKGNHFIALPNCRERITANLLQGKPWYADLAYIPFWQREKVKDEHHKLRKNDEEKDSGSVEKTWFKKLQRYERRQLMSIAKDDRVWGDPSERDMFYAFREVFRRLLNKEDKALGRGGDRDLRKRWDNTADKWHRRLLHAKTKPLLSAAIHELLAEAARSPGKKEDTFVEGGPAFLLKRNEDESPDSWRSRNDIFHAEFRRMVNHPGEWKKVRDLAFLALTTFTDGRFSNSIQEET